MRFGAFLYADPADTAAQSQVLERRGFTGIWFGEVPTVGFADAFQGMRDAAVATDAVDVGTAVTPAGLRHPATLATQLGTLNAGAPGRVRVGYGTGALARRVLGLPPLPLATFRAELEQLRRLLDGEVASPDAQPMAFREPRGGIRLDPPVRLLVAVGGPKTAALAGEFGDGLLTTGVYDPGELGRLRRLAEEAAGAAGRDGQGLGFCLEAGPLCVVREGEALNSPRVLEILEPVVVGYFIFWAALGLGPDEVAPEAADPYASYLVEAKAAYGEDPGELLFGLTAGAMLRRPENDRLLTPELIAACTLTGSHAELRDRLADIERAGVTDIAILRGRSYQWSDGSDLDDLVALMEDL